jgi:hypothetical protein
MCQRSKLLAIHRWAAAAPLLHAPHTAMLSTLAIALLGSAAAGPVLQPPHALRLSHRAPSSSLEKREFAQECVPKQQS